MQLSINDVEHVAELARLGLSDEEKARFRDQLSSILGHIEELNELDTEAIPPTAQVTDLVNVLYEDEPRPSLTREALLASAPRHSRGFFEVHAVLTGSDSSES